MQRKALEDPSPGKQTLTEQLPGAAAEGPAHKTVTTGSSGPDVVLAQARLNEHNATPALVEDGLFGPKTRGATLAFQNASNLTADGIIGPRTWAALEQSGGNGLGQGKGTPSPHQNVNYDTNGHLLAALAVGTSDSKRLSNFVAFVNKSKIEPFTDYARNNWPAKPAEFYAEAFSLFHTDPDFMQTNYKPLFDWFTTGEHLK